MSFLAGIAMQKTKAPTEIFHLTQPPFRGWAYSKAFIPTPSPFTQENRQCFKKINRQKPRGATNKYFVKKIKGFKFEGLAPLRKKLQVIAAGREDYGKVAYKNWGINYITGEYSAFLRMQYMTKCHNRHKPETPIMKKTLLITLLSFLSILGHSEDHFFFLSSDKVVQETQGSLKELRSFSFFPLLKIENENAGKLIALIDQELKKVGTVIKKPALTPEGVDFDSLSHTALQFTIEQLVDEENKPLPVLQANLCVNTVVEPSNTQELSIMSTNRWSIFLEKSNDVEAVIKKALPRLLSQFTADFQRGNSTSQKPTFYIGYDESWWKTQTNR